MEVESGKGAVCGGESPSKAAIFSGRNDDPCCLEISCNHVESLLNPQSSATLVRCLHFDVTKCFPLPSLHEINLSAYQVGTLSPIYLKRGKENPLGEECSLRMQFLVDWKKTIDGKYVSR